MGDTGTRVLASANATRRSRRVRGLEAALDAERGAESRGESEDRRRRNHNAWIT